MAEHRRPRRWLFVLAVLGALLAVGGWWVNRQLEPQRLTATVLKKAGNSLQLNLRFDGVPEYALKPEPRLIIPNLSVSAADGGKVFLFARRAEISLPWSTITGDEPVITRIELQQPVLDVPGLRRWMATLPARPFELPTLIKGLNVTDGRVIDGAFSISALDLDLPRLKTGEAASMETTGRFEQGTTQLDFKLNLTASTPGLASDFTLQGSGALQQEPSPLDFKLRAAGHYVSDDSGFSLQLPELQFEGASPLPAISGKGALKLARQMQWNFDGVLLKWPEAWPALPQPLAANTDRLPVRLSYAGKSDLSDPLSLVVNREPTVLQASLRVLELQKWLVTPGASPLPPINGTLRTPSLMFDGVELQGVEVEISDSPAPSTAALP